MLRKGMFIGDRYEILDKVGSGGMSDVYKAKCHKLNRYVAIKVLKQEFSEDRNFVSKFNVEAQSAAGLSHPNIVSIFDVGEDNGMYYIVMEFIEGITLKRYIQKKGHLSVKEATSIAIQVAQGIECAHNNHIIHRDIKPQNIMISKEGKVKVTDFGIARAVSANTINSNAMGSVHYISPEQARGGYIDEKSDIYSLGITIYEMLTGQMPFEGDSTVAIALQHIQGELPKLKSIVEDLPISTEKIVYKCTLKKADRRYLKISSLIADLKKSLITPDEDFVQFISTVPDDGETVLFNPDDVKAGVVQTSINDLDDTDEAAVTEDEDADEDDIDAVNPKIDRIITIGGIIAGVVFLVIVIMVVMKFVNGGEGTGPDLTTTESETLDERYSYMPDLYNKSVEEAEALLADASLGKKFINVKSNDVEKGYVCDQSITAGEVVAKYTTVTISISQGSDPFEVSNYAGQNLDDVLTELEKLGLKHDISYETNTTAAVNTVISSYPLPPTEVKYGDTITLTVSKGSEYDPNAVVPSVVGAKQDEAESKLNGLGLKVLIATEINESVEKGRVIKQSVKSGEKLPKGSSITITVSEGPSQVKVPSLTNLTTAKAQKALEDVGLKLGAVVKEEFSATVASGKVISQSIKTDTKVDVGSSVDIVVSKGKEPETTTTAPTTTAAKYSGTFTISKNKISDNGVITQGTVVITIDGEPQVLGAYGKLETWPTDSFTKTVTKSEGTICTIVATVDGVEKFRYDLPIK